MEATTKRLQHKHRAGPGQYITVGSQRYELDAEGAVEVPAEAAAAMLQGASWRQYPGWGKQRRAQAAISASAAVGGARPVRTREELLAHADAEGTRGPDAPVPKTWDQLIAFGLSLGIEPQPPKLHTWSDVVALASASGVHPPVLEAPPDGVDGDQHLLAYIAALGGRVSGDVLAALQQQSESAEGGTNESAEEIAFDLSMNTAELQAVATRVGIDTSALKSKRAIYEALVEHSAQQGG
jgi:hypothetical protein